MIKINLIILIILIISIIKLNEYYFFPEPFEYLTNDSYGFCKIFPNFISEYDCNYLILNTGNNFSDSTLIDDSKTSSYIDKSIRSSQVYFYKKKQNKIIESIENKIAQELNIPIDNIEPIQMVKYNNYQEYKEHYDYIEGIINQRTHTFIIYLNSLNENEGGTTNFIKYKKKIRPTKSLGICFRNIDSYSRLNYMSLHSGEKVIGSNPKYILSIWIRKYKYEY